MARSTWKGAVEFGGFPIHLAAYSLIRSKSADSLKTLCPCHQQPVVAPRRCAVTDDAVDTAACQKGVEIGKQLYILDEASLGALEKADRTDVLTIKALPPRSSVPLHLAQKHYRLVPDTKIPGSEGPANILWNGLRGNDRVLVAEWVPRAHARTELLAIQADTFGLTGVTLPYATDFNDVPEHQFAEDAAQVAMFETFATQQAIPMDDFAHTAIEDEYGKRRGEVLAALTSGKPVTTTSTAAPKPAVPDLMAAMKAAMDTAAPTKPKRAPAKPKAAKVA